MGFTDIAASRLNLDSPGTLDEFTDLRDNDLAQRIQPFYLDWGGTVYSGGTLWPTFVTMVSFRLWIRKTAVKLTMTCQARKGAASFFFLRIAIGALNTGDGPIALNAAYTEFARELTVSTLAQTEQTLDFQLATNGSAADIKEADGPNCRFHVT